MDAPTLPPFVTIFGQMLHSQKDVPMFQVYKLFLLFFSQQNLQFLFTILPAYKIICIIYVYRKLIKFPLKVYKAISDSLENC